MTMYLAGGGTPEQESLVWAEAFAGAGRVVYWPFALPSTMAGGAAGWLAAALAGLGLAVDDLDVWPSLDGRRPRELARADLLFVGGGLTSRLAAQVREHGFADAVRDHVHGGGRYYGGSAGAVLCGESLEIAALADGDEDATGQAGLGLLRGAAVLPHADVFGLESSAAWARGLGRTVVAIPEASGLAVDGDRARVLGPDPVRVVRGAGATVHEQGAELTLAG